MFRRPKLQKANLLSVFLATQEFAMICFFGYVITAGVLTLPELPDRFSRLIQPITIRQQVNQFHGAEKLHRIGIRPTQWSQLVRSDENGDIFRRAVQRLRHLSSLRLSVSVSSLSLIASLRRPATR
jgi:hypothetical protein